MGKLFGTDGIRGIAGTELTCEIGYRLGMAVAEVLADTKKDSSHPRVIIGKDTRHSGDMFEAAISSGLCKMGSDAVILGVVPTPAVAYLVKKLRADAGIMISASHNPSEYNGLKVFSGEGYKLSDELEEKIEEIILDENYPLVAALGENIGRITYCKGYADDYVDHVRSVLNSTNTKQRKILFDLSNGSASATAERIFANANGFICDFISDKPNGSNINLNCGSTAIKALSEAVIGGEYDMGIAFDGDADRCLAVDECGTLIDGDKIIAAFAVEMKNAGQLCGNTAVVTSLTNFGFHVMAEKMGINVAITDVGDRYVLEEMLKCGYKVGGEQSGHIILLDFGTTGDGQVTAMNILNLLSKYPDKKASEIFSHMMPLPQVSLNVSVPNAVKKQIAADEEIKCYVDKRAKDLCGRGRILLRPSGTEALVRIMIEGEDQAMITEMARDIAVKIEEKI